jgi:hypothetical protein
MRGDLAHYYTQLFGVLLEYHAQRSLKERIPPSINPRLSELCLSDLHQRALALGQHAIPTCAGRFRSRGRDLAEEIARAWFAADREALGLPTLFSFNAPFVQQKSARHATVF